MKSAIVMMAAVLIGCGGKPAAEEVTTTRGPLVVIASDDLATLADTLAREFARIYPEVRPSTSASPTREAFVHLLNDSVRTIVVDRPMNAEERKVVAESGVEVVGTVLALDALAVVVHADNPLTGLSVADLGRLVRGTITQWRQVPGSGRTGAVEFVCTGRNTGLHEQIMRLVTGGDGLSVFAVGATQRELVEYVGRSPRAMAVVSMAALRDRPSTTRLVPVEAVVDTVTGRTELVLPSQTSVDEGRYPLRTQILLYNAERRLGPGAGLPAFALTTPGQKIVQQSGLVPAVIPNRVIQLTAE